ncbi:MAG TPA: serine hydrolase domain-containing protein, partial [Longimicrobium sp.]|nr:serine hydrolase domain-containing protein [Longimicrobium sp.]
MKKTDIPSILHAVLAITLMAASGSLPAPAPRSSPPSIAHEGDEADAIGAVMREYLRRVEAFGFAGAAAVEVDGRLVVSRGYGMADRARGIAVTDETPFYVASVSKQFTAAAVLRLEMEGRLRTADTLGRFFPGAPPEMARITLHQLLTHTAGVGEITIGEGPADAEDFARAVFALPPRFAPGTGFAYSNTGYALLAAVVQRASGEAFGAYLHRALFAPAGMTRTAAVTHADRLPGVRDARAYRGGIDFGGALRPEHTGAWSALGGTGVVTSVADLYRWERALRDTAVLSAAAKAKLFAPERERYAYGWVVAPTRRGTTRVTHDGLLFPHGWSAAFDRYADEGVVVLAVSGTFEREGLAAPVSRDLARIALGGSVALPPAPLAPRRARRRPAGAPAGRGGGPRSRRGRCGPGRARRARPAPRARRCRRRRG